MIPRSILEIQFLEKAARILRKPRNDRVVNLNTMKQQIEPQIWEKFDCVLVLNKYNFKPFSLENVEMFFITSGQFCTSLMLSTITKNLLRKIKRVTQWS